MMFLTKIFTSMLLFTLLAVSGLLLIEPCVAPVTMPANPKLGPEVVSVEINNAPIWVPPVTYTHPYTGEVTYSTSGYWKQNGTILITIKNRPFTPYTDTNGNTINVYYSASYKISTDTLFWTYPHQTMYQSDSAYTVIKFAYGSGGMLDMRSTVNVKEGEIVDFRIQAVTGYFKPGWSDSMFFTGGYHVEPIYEGEGSKYVEFSITIPPSDKPGSSKPNIQPSTPNLNIPSTSNPDNPHSQTPWQSYLITILITACIITIPVAVVAYLNKQQQRKTDSTTNTSATEIPKGKINYDSPL